MTALHRASTMGGYRMSAFLIVLALNLAGPAQAADYYVTSCVDNCAVPTPGTLRWAIDQANLNPGWDDLRFDGLTCTITLSCELPALTDPGTRILGETAAPGGITLEGSGVVSAGFRIETSDCVVRGLTIQNFYDYGILIESPVGAPTLRNTIGGVLAAHLNEITGNWAGIQLSGAGCDSNTVVNNRASGNSAYGIRLYEGPSFNVIGGLAGNQPNSASQNGNYGIYLGGEVQGNLILGNFVGTNRTGMLALGNGWDGIHLSGDQCSDNVVRGNRACDNAMNGISIEGSAWGNRVEFNIVGVDATGNGALGNHLGGILVAELAHDNHIGPGNLVSANEGTGIEIVYPGTDRNDVFQNTVGLNAAENDSLPNWGHGVHLNGVSDCEVWENVISGNRWNGVEVTDGAFPAHVVRDNLIGTNDSWDLLGNKGDGIHLVQVAVGHEIRGNTIGDNLSAGIFIEETCNNNSILGNWIGIDPGGTIPLPNHYGIVLQSTENWIGGTAAGEGNVISHNTVDGIRMRNLNTVQIHNHIKGNRIEHNGNHGVSIQDGMVKNFVGGENLGDPPESGNIIHNNGSAGIFCGENGALVPPVENRFLSNSITSNGGPGIRILATAPPGNDAIPAPTIVSASVYGVRGVTNLGGNDSMVQLFIDGADEGETLVAEIWVTGTEDWAYFATLPESVNVTATNTGRWPTPASTYETSEFSSAALTAVGEEPRAFLPAAFRMGRVSPNPFGRSTEVSFDVPEAAPVSLTVYDATGRRVRTLVDGAIDPGTHAVSWDARDDAGRTVAPGVYFCRFQHARGSEMRKLVLLR